MIPNVFISSTVEDLHHLRDAVRETILELSYLPVMSEYEDIGYLPTSTAEESCYATIRDCQLAIIIIGKRYGSKSENGLSITHNEFRNARERNKPVIFIVDSEVMSYKRIYDANKHNVPSFPGMDAPHDTFQFIQEVIDSPLNNGILTFSRIFEAREHLKKQIAHLFGELLIHRFDPLKSQIQDVLSEIKTLRHELLKDSGSSPIRYLKATRFLLDDKDENKDYRQLIQAIIKDIDVAIPILLDSKTFDEFLKKIKVSLEINNDSLKIREFMDAGELRYATQRLIGPTKTPADDRSKAFWAILIGKKVIMNEEAKKYFNYIHDDLVRETTI